MSRRKRIATAAAALVALGGSLGGYFAAQGGAPTVPLAPGVSWNTACKSASSGTVFELSGTYAGQSLTCTVPVTFRPAPGATVTLTGELRVMSGAHLTFEDMAVDDTYTKTSTDITYRNLSQGPFFVRSSTGIRFLSGDVGDNTVGDSATIGSSGSGAAPSTDVLVDSVAFHDMNSNDKPGTHDECLFIQEATGVVVQNSTFTRCQDFNIYANRIFGGVAPEARMLGNHFAPTAPKGYYAFRANVGSFYFERNTWQQGMANDAGVVVTGCGNVIDGSGFSTTSIPTAPCSGPPHQGVLVPSVS